MSETTNSQKQPVFTKHDLNWYWLSWMQHCACGYNYARMMGSGVAQVLKHPLNKLYPNDKKKQGEEIKKHLSFFNTEPHLGSLIIGSTIALEEERSKGEPVKAADIEKIKSSLMGPVAGIGDSLIQGAIIPIFLSIGIGLALQGNILGPILFAVICSGGTLWLSHYCFFEGYKLGKEAILRFISNGTLQQILAGAGIVGCSVMGALAASTVTAKLAVNIPLYSTDGTSFLNLQTGFLDPVFKGIIPLVIIILVMKAFNKGCKPNNILFITLGISFVLGAIGIIG